MSIGEITLKCGKRLSNNQDIQLFHYYCLLHKYIFITKMYLCFLRLWIHILIYFKQLQIFFQSKLVSSFEKVLYLLLFSQSIRNFFHFNELGALKSLILVNLSKYKWCKYNFFHFNKLIFQTSKTNFSSKYI